MFGCERYGYNDLWGHAQLSKVTHTHTHKHCNHERHTHAHHHPAVVHRDGVPLGSRTKSSSDEPKEETTILLDREEESPHYSSRRMLKKTRQRPVETQSDEPKR